MIRTVRTSLSLQYQVVHMINRRIEMCRRISLRLKFGNSNRATLRVTKKSLDRTHISHVYLSGFLFQSGKRPTGSPRTPLYQTSDEYVATPDQVIQLLRSYSTGIGSPVDQQEKYEAMGDTVIGESYFQISLSFTEWEIMRQTMDLLPNFATVPESRPSSRRRPTTSC
jgi:hypothetical protein